MQSPSKLRNSYRSTVFLAESTYNENSSKTIFIAHSMDENNLLCISFCSGTVGAARIISRGFAVSGERQESNNDTLYERLWLPYACSTRRIWVQRTWRGGGILENHYGGSRRRVEWGQQSCPCATSEWIKERYSFLTAVAEMCIQLKKKALLFFHNVYTNVCVNECEWVCVFGRVIRESVWMCTCVWISMLTSVCMVYAWLCECVSVCVWV